MQKKCRTILGESPSTFLSEKHIVQDLLGDLHQDRDHNDWAILSGAKPRFSESRLKSRSRASTSGDMKIDNGSNLSMKDFLTPQDPTEIRTVGYTSGHVRSITEADTFGPNHSLEVQMKRSGGLVPSSPNTDKNRLFVTEEERMQFMQSSKAMDVMEKAKTLQLSNNFISGLSNVDCRTKRNHWFESYQNRVKSKRNRKWAKSIEARRREVLQREVDSERESIEQFEANMRARSKFGGK